MRAPASIVLVMAAAWVSPALGQAALNYREDLPHQMMIGSMPSPTPCDVRINHGYHDENCLWDPRFHHYVDVKDDPRRRQLLEEANVAAGPRGDFVGDSFGRPGFYRPSNADKKSAP